MDRLPESQKYFSCSHVPVLTLLVGKSERSVLPQLNICVTVKLPANGSLLFFPKENNFGH